MQTLYYARRLVLKNRVIENKQYFLEDGNEE